MTSRQKIVLGLGLLAVPHLLYEIRVGLISASQVVPPVEGGVLPLAALAGEPVLSLSKQLTNLPLVMALVGVFAAAALIGARYFTSAIRPAGFETRPWTESTSDFCFAVAVAFHVTLLGSFAPWMRTGGNLAWALVPGFLTAFGVFFAIKAPKDTPPELAAQKLLPLPLLMLVCGAVSLGALKVTADGHAASHLAMRASFVAAPSLMGFWARVLIRSVFLSLWTSGLLLLGWGAAIKCGRRIAVASVLIALSAGGWLAAIRAHTEVVRDISDAHIGPALLSPTGSPTILLLHDEAQDQRRITPRMLPETVWSLILTRPLKPIDFLRTFELRPNDPVKPVLDDLYSSSGIARMLPERIDEGLRLNCFDLHRAAACGALLERITGSRRRPEYDSSLYAFLDEKRFRLDDASRKMVEAAFSRQGETEKSRVEIRLTAGGVQTDGAVLFSVPDDSVVPGADAPTSQWMAFIERHLVDRVWFKPGEPAVFENLPPGRYLLGVIIRGARQRYVVESGNPIGPFEVGPGSVQLPPVSISTRAIGMNIGVPAFGP